MPWVVVNDWVNIAFDMMYYNNVVERAYESSDTEINQTWVDQKILYGIVTPSHVYDGLGAVIIRYQISSQTLQTYSLLPFS